MSFWLLESRSLDNGQMIVAHVNHEADASKTFSPQVDILSRMYTLD